MGDADATNIYRELGGIAKSLENIERRLLEVEHKQDKSDEILADVKHMRANIAMMKQPVEEYQKFKQRGIGAWLTISGILGGISTVASIAAYLIRAYVLGIGTP